jgi:transcriptional regulator with XRE-family HTH domain
MEISFVEISDIKRKFGNLLSNLHNNAHIALENISDAMVNSNFLDIFENGDIEEFLSQDNNDIIKSLFPNVIISNNINNDVGALYWSGIQYINIFLNYRIPLRIIFLTCPLSKMVNKFDIYHEMNEIELCNDYLKNEFNNVSILKYFRKKKGLSLRQLAEISSISETTLRYYESNNSNFFNASYKNITLLSNTLDINKSFLSNKSTFVPSFISLLTNKYFLLELSRSIGDTYLKGKYPNIRIEFYKNNKATSGEAYLFINDYPHLSFDNKDYYIDQSLFKELLSNALDKYVKNNLVNNLVF